MVDDWIDWYIICLNIYVPFIFLSFLLDSAAKRLMSNVRSGHLICVCNLAHCDGPWLNRFRSDKWYVKENSTEKCHHHHHFFLNVYFFHAQLGLDVFPDMRLLHTSLNTTHSECKPSSSISSFTHSLQVILPLSTHLTPATTTFLQADIFQVYIQSYSHEMLSWVRLCGINAHSVCWIRNKI